MCTLLTLQVANLSISVLAIAGNKVDLASYKQVQTKKAKAYADSIGAIFYETSAMTNEGKTIPCFPVCALLVIKHAASANL